MTAIQLLQVIYISAFYFYQKCKNKLLTFLIDIFNKTNSASTATPEITTEAVTATTEEASTSTSTSLEVTAVVIL